MWKFREKSFQMNDFVSVHNMHVVLKTLSKVAKYCISEAFQECWHSIFSLTNEIFGETSK